MKQRWEGQRDAKANTYFPKTADDWLTNLLAVQYLQYSSNIVPKKVSTVVRAWFPFTNAERKCASGDMFCLCQALKQCNPLQLKHRLRNRQGHIPASRCKSR